MTPDAVCALDCAGNSVANSGGIKRDFGSLYVNDVHNLLISQRLVLVLGAI
jgi:hypothetical protein